MVLKNGATSIERSEMRQQTQAARHSDKPAGHSDLLAKEKEAEWLHDCPNCCSNLHSHSFPLQLAYSQPVDSSDFAVKSQQVLRLE